MLNIIVVGGGIAGLTAAISLRRAGHIVTVFERSSMNNEIGAAMNVPPNATRFLTAWGLDPVRWRFVKPKKITWVDPFSLEIKGVTATEETASTIGGANLWYAHRVDLHNALKWMATRPDGPGKPVTINLKSDVVGYNPDEPSISLQSGEKLHADVVIGADGVHSLACEAVIGHANPPVRPAHANSCYRFLISTDVVEKDPDTRFWNEDMDGWLRLIPDNDGNKRIVVYPCRDNTVHNFVALFQDERSHEEGGENWQAGVDVSEVLERFSNYNPKILKLVSKATEVKRWPLLYRHPIPQWYKGNMALVGDAAHPMLPHQAQGGAQGMEDGLAIGLVLAGATCREQITERLELYDQIRRNRASAIQILSNVGQDQTYLVREGLLKYMGEDEIPTNFLETWRYNFRHDVVKVTVEKMKEFDSGFKLPDGFFESEVFGVPQDQNGSNDHQ